jgi:hypothetical protein
MLYILDLGFTDITDQDLTSIEPTLARLRVLCLNATPITDHGLDVFHGVAHLKDLSLPDQITDERIREFRKKSPSCKINEGWSTNLNQ